MIHTYHLEHSPTHEVQYTYIPLGTFTHTWSNQVTGFWFCQSSQDDFFSIFLLLWLHRVLCVVTVIHFWFHTDQFNCFKLKWFNFKLLKRVEIVKWCGFKGLKCFQSFIMRQLRIMVTKILETDVERVHMLWRILELLKEPWCYWKSPAVAQVLSHLWWVTAHLWTATAGWV